MSARDTILIVDDEPNNVSLLEMYLEDEGMQLLTAEDGATGWALLQEHQSRIAVILLDRMMPQMNGMEFVAKMKEEEALSFIPVVMQTAAAERSQVAQGVKAGVYYYLTKPYDEESLLSVVRAAIRDYGQYHLLRRELQQFRQKINLVKESAFEVTNMQDVRYLTTFLANFYPDSARVIFGIAEMLTNAIEHGSLGIGYQEKSELLKQGRWAQEIDERTQSDAYSDKIVYVHFKREKERILLTIRDEGEGFSWQRYLEIDASRATDNHGRGIALARMMSFDELEYKGNGNTVVCTVYL